MTEAPLSAESTLGPEPEKQLLKSYAQVLEEDPPAYEKHDIGATNGTINTMDTKRPSGTAPVLRIVNTHAPTGRKEEARGDTPEAEKESKKESTAAVWMPNPDFFIGRL